MQDYTETAYELGFTRAFTLNAREIPFDEVDILRQGCEANDCGNYGTSWCCPPGVGTKEEVEAKVKRWQKGIMVQFITEVIDVSFQPELFREINAAFGEMVQCLYETVKEREGDCYMLGKGHCDLCKKCTYPDEPCRFPEKAAPCLSSHGINVGKLWETSGFPRGRLDEFDSYALILYGREK